MCLGVPGKVLEILDGDLRMARIAYGPVVKEASLACVPDARIGDYVVVHAGFALEVIDEDAAQKTLGYLAEIDALAEADVMLPIGSR